MRVDRFGALRSGFAALRQAVICSSVLNPQDTISTASRRDFLQATGNITGASVAAQAMPWMLSFGRLNQEDYFRTTLTKKLQVLIAVPENNKDAFSTGLDELLKAGRRDREIFLRWYTDQVNDKNQNLQFQRKQIVLEIIGKKVIAGGEMHSSDVDLLEREKYVGEFFPLYTTLIRNNNLSRDFLAGALMTCDAVIFPRLKEIKQQEYSSGEIGSVGTAVSEGILNLYEVALRGVSRLPVIDGELKSLIFEIPWDCEVFGDKQEKTDLEKGIVKEDLIKKAHDRVIAVLSENFFGLKQDKPDNDGFNRLANRVNLTDTPPASGWPPYILYGVMDKNPEYFESVVNNCISDVKKSLASLGERDLANLEKLAEPVINCLSFFSNLRIAGQSYYFTDRLPHHYPQVPKERKERVDRWAEKIMNDITKSAIASFFEIVENEKIIVETKGKQKTINGQRWNELINQFAKLLEGKPILCEGFAYAIRNRLQKDKDEPLLTELNYKALGVSIPVELTVSGPSYSLTLIKETLPGEKSLEAIRGTGTALAMSMFYGHRNNEFRFSSDFLLAFEEFNKDNFSKLNDLETKKLNELEKFVLMLVRLVQGSDDIYRALIPDFIFPEYSEDGSHRKKVKPFFELKQNAFLLLASSASAIDVIDPHGQCPKQAYTKYQKAVIEFPESQFGFYTDPETIGEQIGTLIKLYNSVYPNSNQSKNFAYFRAENLRELFNHRVLNPLRRSLLHEAMHEQKDSRPVTEDTVDKLMKEYPQIDDLIKKYKIRQARLALNFASDEFEIKDFQEHLTVNMKIMLPEK